MDFHALLPTLLGLAWLLPLASFVLIVFFGKRMGHGGKAAGAGHGQPSPADSCFPSRP